MQVLVFLCSPPLEAWVPPPQSLTNVWPSFCLLSRRSHAAAGVMSWLRCRLGFSLLHSAIMCIRGSHSSSGRPLRGHVPASIDLALEGDILGLSKPHLSFYLVVQHVLALCWGWWARTVHLAQEKKKKKHVAMPL